MFLRELGDSRRNPTLRRMSNASQGSSITTATSPVHQFRGLLQHERSDQEKEREEEKEIPRHDLPAIKEHRF